MNRFFIFAVVSFPTLAIAETPCALVSKYVESQVAGTTRTSADHQVWAASITRALAENPGSDCDTDARINAAVALNTLETPEAYRQSVQLLTAGFPHAQSNYQRAELANEAISAQMMLASKTHEADHAPALAIASNALSRLPVLSELALQCRSGSEPARTLALAAPLHHLHSSTIADDAARAAAFTTLYSELDATWVALGSDTNDELNAPRLLALREAAIAYFQSRENSFSDYLQSTSTRADGLQVTRLSAASVDEAMCGRSDSSEYTLSCLHTALLNIRSSQPPSVLRTQTLYDVAVSESRANFPTLFTDEARVARLTTAMHAVWADVQALEAAGSQVDPNIVEGTLSKLWPLTSSQAIASELQRRFPGRHNHVAREAVSTR